MTGPCDEIGDGVSAPRGHEDALRRILQSEAAAVHPSGDGLARIRARTTRRGLRAWYVPALAGLAAVAVVTTVLWGAGVIQSPSSPPVADRPHSSSTAPATPNPSGTVTVIPTPTRSLPVYYVGSQQVGIDAPATELVLFREYHSLPATDDRSDWVRASLEEMFANTAVDPDYHAGIWPTTVTVRHVTIDESAKSITVDLGGIADLRTAVAPDAMDAFTAAAVAVQQVVYDATGAANADEAFSARKVTILADGAPLGELWGAPVAESLQRDTTAEAAIWIEMPRQDATVGSPVTVSGEAIFDEAQGQWALLDANGNELQSGPVRTPESGVRGPFTIDLGPAEPGSYTIKVYDIGGLGVEGRGPVDTKTFTVK